MRDVRVTHLRRDTRKKGGVIVSQEQAERLLRKHGTKVRMAKALGMSVVQLNYALKQKGIRVGVSVGRPPRKFDLDLLRKQFELLPSWWAVRMCYSSPPEMNSIYMAFSRAGEQLPENAGRSPWTKRRARTNRDILYAWIENGRDVERAADVTGREVSAVKSVLTELGAEL